MAKFGKTTIVDTMRVAWRTVGSIVSRVVNRYRPGDQLEGLTHLGVEELSFRKHHSYVTVVIDHVRERVVWVLPGKSAETLGAFFKDLGPERCEKLESVTFPRSAHGARRRRRGAPLRSARDEGNLIGLIFLCCSGIALLPVQKFPRGFH